jgi:hypothetical protein
MITRFNRRHFLCGMGSLIALPALESIGFRRFADGFAGLIKRAMDFPRLFYYFFRNPSAPQTHKRCLPGFRLSSTLSNITKVASG